jgi:hypothetical protein
MTGRTSTDLKKAEEQMWEKERKRLTTAHTYETLIRALGNGLSKFFRPSHMYEPTSILPLRNWRSEHRHRTTPKRGYEESKIDCLRRPRWTVSVAS